MSSLTARARAFLIRLSCSVRGRRSASEFDEELGALVSAWRPGLNQALRTE